MVWEVSNPNDVVAPAIFLFGANSVGSTTTTRFLAPGNVDALAQTTIFEMEVGRAGTLRNLFVTQNVPGGDGDPIVYTVLVNGAPTALLVSMLSTAASGSDIVNSVAVVQGDNIAIRVTKAASISPGSPDNIVASVEFGA